MPKWKILMCDFNGTLIDDVRVNYLGVAAVFEKFGLPVPTLEEYRNEITADITSFYYNRGVPKEFTPAEMNELYGEVIEKHWENVQLMTGAHSLLAYCKKVLQMKCVLITAASQKRLTRRLIQLNIEDKFDGIVADALKKEVAIRDVIGKFNLNPEDGVYLGDTVADIEAGKKAGVATIGFAMGYNSEAKIQAANPDFVTTSLYKALMIIDKGGEQ